MDEVEAVARAVHGELSHIDVMKYLDMPDDTADRVALVAIAALDAVRGDSEPVAWLYEHPEGYYNTTTRRDDPSLPTYRGWIETPLYAHPPRGDQVARFVAHMKTLQPDEDVAECPATWGDFLQILEAEAEAWEPFNG